MKMKIKILAVFILLIIPVLSLAQNAIQEETKISIENRINSITEAINKQDLDFFKNALSPEASPDLSAEIVKKLQFPYINFTQKVKNIDKIDENTFRVSCGFSAYGSGWNINNLNNYYILEKENDNFLILDTNFHQRLGADYVFELVGKIFLIITPIVLVLFAFWIWMLIDCIKRDFNDKLMWVIIIIFLNALGAILYFLIIRRQLIKNNGVKQ